MHSEDFRKQTYTFELAKILFFDIMFFQRSYSMTTNTILSRNDYSEKFKRNIITMFLRGRNGRRLRDKYHIPKSTFYYWVEEYKKIYSQDGLIITKHDYKKLEWENARMKKQLEAYQITGCSPQSTDKDKLIAIDKYRMLYPIKYLCTVLNINRTKFYRYITHKETQTEKRIKKITCKIKEIARNNPCYGSKRICHELKRQGFITSYKTVSRLMRENGIQAIIGQTPSRQQNKDTLNDNVLKWQKKYALSAPDIAWLSDVTEIKLLGIKFYICSIEDIYSRYIISYTISSINDSALVANTFIDAYAKRNPPYGLIFHSDNGASFTATAIRVLLKSYGIRQSFSKVATPQDNGHIESFFATLKKEELYRKTYHSPEEFFLSVKDYIEYYNTSRLHSRLGYKTPKEVLNEYGERHNQEPF